MAIKDVPSEKGTTTLKDTLQSTFPIGLVIILNLQGEDNLSTKDNMAGPKVSFIQKLDYSRHSCLCLKEGMQCMNAGMQGVCQC